MTPRCRLRTQLFDSVDVLKNQSELPKSTETQQPHIGGPILQGSHNVLINGKSAARVSDSVHCEHQPDTIINGAEGVLINNKPIARENDKTGHGGEIKNGSHNIIIGE